MPWHAVEMQFCTVFVAVTVASESLEGPVFNSHCFKKTKCSAGKGSPVLVFNKKQMKGLN